MFTNLTAKNWKTSGQKFLILFVVFALLFAVVPVHLVAADDSSDSSDSSSSEVETGFGSISGFLWVDGNGMQLTDWNGFYDIGEQPLAGYPVYLYAANNPSVHIAQTQTSWDGTYIFENLEPGNYIVGITSSFINDIEYMLPMSVTGENKFAIDWRSNPIMAFTDTLIVTANGSVENINGGMRLPMGFEQAWTTTGGGTIPVTFAQLKNRDIIGYATGNGVNAVTGSVQLQPNKIYGFEVWGASGGIATGLGGWGGDSTGWYSTMGNTAPITAWYYVGGQGGGVGSGLGGYNGGGNGSVGGGGATDIRIGGQTLNNRVIVAGGGGGYSAGGVLNGGFGGGISGSFGAAYLDGGGSPGTQTAGGAGGIQTGLAGSQGAFGQGGDGGASLERGGGGGGGYYGGGGGSSGTYAGLQFGGGGGGGSGYIGGVDGLIGSPAETNQRISQPLYQGIVRIAEYDIYAVMGTVKDINGNNLNGVTVSYTINGAPGTTTTTSTGAYLIIGNNLGDTITITDVTLARHTLDTTVRPVPAAYVIGSPNLFYSGIDFTMNLPPVWMDIDLANDDGSLTNTAWSSYYHYNAGVLTIRSDAPASHTGPVAYRIWQNRTHPVAGIAVNPGVTTSIIIDGITMTGDFNLNGNANVDLLLAGTNTITGSVLVPNRGAGQVATIRIDSATAPGSSVGMLTVTTNSRNAAIGGLLAFPNAGNIIIDGGRVTARNTAPDYNMANPYSGAGIGGAGGDAAGGGGNGGSITINGGTVTATSSQGAGIGGGATFRNGDGAGGGTILITGGSVTATSNVWGAGIGGGPNLGLNGGPGGDITISGGTVTATGNQGAGIGGGGGTNGGAGGTININGNAEVTARGSVRGAGIGGGGSTIGGGAGGTININDNAVVTATGGLLGGSGIGGGSGSSFSGIGATLTIANTATVLAFSTPAPTVLRPPAIHSTGGIGGGGFVVHNNINAASADERIVSVFNEGTTDMVNLLTHFYLPGNYVNYAYSIPGAGAANYYEMMACGLTGDPIGQVVRISDSSPLIYSVNTNAVLPVRLAAIYSVTNDIANTALDNTTVLQGTNYAGTLTADPGYALPLSITMTRDGAAFSGFAYNNFTGVITITSAQVTGDFEISGTALTARYVVTKDGDPTWGTFYYYMLADAVTKCGDNTGGDSYTITALTNDPNMTNSVNTAVTIPANKNITLTSDAGRRTITQTSASRHFIINGQLTLENIILDGNGNGTPGGGVQTGGSGAKLIMSGGAAIQNSSTATSSNGGGVEVGAGSIFEMNGGEIRTNAAANNGSGVFIGNGGTMTMTDGIIIGNRATFSGGGISAAAGSDLTFSPTGYILIRGNEALGAGGGISADCNLVIPANVIIEGNTAFLGGGVSSGGQLTLDGGSIVRNTGTFSGGGVVVAASMLMTDGTISDNNAGIGGGIFVTTASANAFTMTGGTISGNTAGSLGGGISTSSPTYANLNISAPAVFSSNYAGLGASIPIANALTEYPNIRTTSSSIFDHPLNNYDINAGGPYFHTWNITERFVDISGNELAGEQVTYVLHNAPVYNKTHPVIPNYALVGYYVGDQFSGGLSNTGTPVIIDQVSGDMIIYFVYDVGYTITEKYVDVNGNPINPPGTTMAGVFQSFRFYSTTLPTLSGYVAFGWMWEADFLSLSGSDFPITTMINGFSAGHPSLEAIANDETVYFVYHLGYNTIYNDNGGSGGPGTINDRVSGTYGLSSPNPTHPQVGTDNVLFLGWTLDTNVSGVILGATDSEPAYASDVVITNAHVTLFAVWGLDTGNTGTPDVRKDKYNTIYNDNGGTGGPGTISDRIPGTYALSATEPTHPQVGTDDVLFLGWTLDASVLSVILGATDSEPVYAPDVVITNAHVTLYAVWGLDTGNTGTPDIRKDKYNTIYNDNGGSGGPGTISDRIPGTYALSATEPTHPQVGTDNVLFLGWTLDTSVSGIILGATDSEPVYAMDVVITNAHVTLFAVWGLDTGNTGTPDVQKDKYDTIYNDNGGTGGPGTISDRIPGTYALSATEPTHPQVGTDNVLFLGWTLDTSVSNIILGATDSEPVYAMNVVITNAHVTLFAVWGLDTGNTGTPDVQKDKYDTIYNDNGGTGGPGTITNVLNGTHALSTIEPTHAPIGSDDVWFIGWTLDASIFGVVLDKDGTVPTIATNVIVNGANVELYAVWGLDTTGTNTPDVLDTKYSIIYNNNGGTGGPGTITNVLNGTHALSTIEPTHAPIGSDAVLFIGWTLDATITGVVLDKDGTVPTIATNVVVNGANVNLYAVWGLDTDGNGIPDVSEDWFTITVDYEMRNGSAVAGMTGFTRQISDGSTYAPTTAEMTGTDVVLVDWELNGALQGNVNPTISSITAAATIILIYGQDKNNDGIEDFTITEKHESQLGGALIAASEVYVNINDSYIGSPDAALVAGAYTYEGYQWDADTTNVTNPIDPVTVANIVADHTIIFIYSPNEYMISVTREMRDGTPILGEPDLSDNVIHGTGFDLTSAQMFINGRTFVDWMLDGILQGNTVVSLTNVVSFHNIVLVYDDASGNNNTGGSGYGNATITGPQGGTSQQPEQRPPEDRLQEPEFEQEPEEQQNGGQQNDGQQNGGQQNGGDEPKQSIIDPLWLAVIMMLLAAAVFILFYLWRDEEEEEERGP